MHAFLKTGKLGPGTSPLPKPGKSGERKKSPKPWVEKYRPKNIDEIVYQDEVVAVLRKTLAGADLPNLLFYGPPGTGKTSTILAAARQLFGDIYKDRVLELNASDERGIQVIREKVKNFAQTAVSSIKANGKPCPPFKIIILDEADSMTTAAQAALRRTMEKQSKTTRFCLLCNYVSRIIDPITSRCSKFRFKPLPKDALMKHLRYICESESVKCDDLVLERLINGSGGDLRRAITCLQSVSRLRAADTVSEEDVDEVIGVIPTKYLDEFMEACGTNSFEKISDFINEMMFEAYSASQLLHQVHDNIIEDVSLDSDKKGRLVEKIAHCEARLCDGADEYLQLLDLGVAIMNELSRKVRCNKFP